MRAQFIIASNKSLNKNQLTGFDLINDSDIFQFFVEKNNAVKELDDLTIFIYGYVLPKNLLQNKYSNQGQHDLVLLLYQKYKDGFLQLVKGAFIIVIIHNRTIKVFNDHLGICKFFYYISKNEFYISSSFNLLTNCSKDLTLNYDYYLVKPLLNREISGETFFSKIAYSKAATKFQSDLKGVSINFYWNPDSLLENEQVEKNYYDFSDIIKKNVTVYNEFLKPSTNTISLTGGKDSRTALAALLSAAIKPVGITYGDPLSKDAVFANILAKKIGMRHEIFNQPKTVEDFDTITKEIIELQNPTINIHRGHRFYAFKKMNELLGIDNAYYAGYMGGELLMGIYYDNLIFTNFLTDSWNKGSQFDRIPDLYKWNFLRLGIDDFGGIHEKLGSLKTVDASLNARLREFHALFEIGVSHHSQDLQLAMQFANFPIPFFLDIDFLEALFSTKFSFLYRNNKTKNLYKRYHLYEFNLNIQHILYPELDSIPFAKRGCYNTKEFLVGPSCWSFKKAIRYLTEKKKYPPTFSYNESYRLFLSNWLNNISIDKNSPINDIYDVKRALKSIKLLQMPASENELTRFSNIVMHYLQLKRYLG